MATGDGNTELVRRLYGGLMAEGDTAVADDLLADDYLDHDIPGVGEGGRRELVAAVQAVRAAFPDIAPTLGPILADARVVMSSVHDRPAPADAVFLGEVGLGGEVRPVSGLERRLGEAERQGFRRVFLSSRSRVLSGLDVVGIEHVGELARRLAA